jgi:molecular chaperone HscB
MKNYFELFNLTPKFTIDLNEIEQKYHQFQNQFHPDKADFNSIEHSILINEAYKILSDDFLRASHLLQLKNIDIENDENHIKPDISTLQAILDLQEEIFEINNLDEILVLKNNLNSQIKNLINNFQNAFEGNELNEATQFLIKAKYLKKSLIDLKNRQKNLK